MRLQSQNILLVLLSKHKRKNSKLIFTAKKSPKLKGENTFYKNHIFIVKWNDRSLDADAFVKFFVDKNGNATSFKPGLNIKL
ncbi:MAG: DUF3471 domain-containing protein [Sphingobacteriales bacterium]|nr:MAG: DUF3471 domain-containing protein [Sphingobacteriales bacterium]